MIEKNVVTALIMVTSSLVLTLAGCASAVDRDYGKAAHQMVTVQVANPETLRLPLGGIVEGVDPDSAKAAVDAMRKDTAERTHTDQPVIFTYGAPGGGSSQ